jgi:hypothetical protein
MKQPGIFIIFFLFLAGVSVVLVEEERVGQHPLTAVLTGDVSGKPDGSSAGSIKLLPNLTGSRLCYEMDLKGPTMASVNIVSGSESTGPVVVSFKTPSNNSTNNCVSVDPDRIIDILRNPANYSVTVSTIDSSRGAIRGQLEN